jgi:hypothetical protein
MADFRKLFYALAMVALVVGLSIPASAQGGAVTCNAQTTPTLARAEGYAELVGDYVLQCFGGTPTTPGQPVPQLNVTVFLSTNITSKLTTSNGVFDESLLIFDEPNTPGNPTRPIRNCGAANEDVGPAGPGVCSIIAPPSTAAAPTLPNPAATYDGSSTCTGSVGGGASTYGCSRPNVFQGRLGAPQNTGQNSIVVFAGVPFDPPGTQTTRTLRITNIRADAEFLGVSSTFTQQAILMSVSFTNTTFVTINNFSGQSLTVATVLRGLSASAASNLGFLQCVSENAGLTTGKSTSGGDFPQPAVTFLEGFQNAWKTKNVSFVTTAGPGAGFIGNGTLGVGTAQFAGTINYPGDLAQNVPGNNYNTEAGFEFNATTPIPAVNPPTAQGTQIVNPPSNGSIPLTSSATGIANAGSASQGTRLAMSFSNQAQGVSIWVPPVVDLVNQLTGNITGIMVLTNTAADGSGAYSPPTGISAANAATSAKTSNSSACNGAGVVNGPGCVSIGTNALVQVSNGLAVYEILFTDPNTTEQATVPVVVSYVSNLSANPPIGLPVPGQVEQVAASFAPFYSSSTARQPSLTLPVPRFIPSSAPLNIIEVVKCACDLLFPFVTAQSGFDTGIAIANTSLDPGAAVLGIGAIPQQGTVTFYYFGVGNNGAAPPASQTSGNVPAGQVLTYVLSSGGGSIGTAANGLDNRANGFGGYIIAQAGFQYCHAYAFVSSLGGGPTSAGVSEGYLGLILDRGGLLRTTQASENLVH